jgi:hypothetical protein
MRSRKGETMEDKCKKRDTFKFAGQTVKIKPEVKKYGGAELLIEDYWENIFGSSWMFAKGNPAAMEYAVRVALSKLPINDDVVYGKIGMIGKLFHVTELELPG